MNITKEQKELFDKEGYLFFPSIFSKKEVQNLLQAVPELYEIRGDWVMALTPGGVDQDLYRLGYKKIKRPMFPLDKDMEDPDLNAVLIPVLK